MICNRNDFPDIGCQAGNKETGLLELWHSSCRFYDAVADGSTAKPEPVHVSSRIMQPSRVTKVGTSRCDVPARVAAGGIVRAPIVCNSSYVCAADTRRGRRSAPSLPARALYGSFAKLQDRSRWHHWAAVIEKITRRGNLMEGARGYWLCRSTRRATAGPG
jgi:hypothetical protein